MAVKLELYRVFQEVARMGNISAAAQNLYISQSAVSQSIKQLEEQLQVRLCSRSTRGRKELIMAKRYPNTKSIQMSFLFIEAREQITGLYYRAQKKRLSV